MDRRLSNRIFGRFVGRALKEVCRIVKDNGGLDTSEEYGSIEIEDKEFEAERE